MGSVQQREEHGVLNETTMTVHRHETGASDFNVVCGHTYHVDPETLSLVEVQRATGDLNASKCGQCFEDSGGY